MDHGEQALFFTIYDKDGSLIGNNQTGYLVANNTAILPPGMLNCTPKPAMNLYSCSGACYRSLYIGYLEPGFSFNPNNPKNTRGSFRSVVIGVGFSPLYI